MTHQVRAVQAGLGGGEDADLPPLRRLAHHRFAGLPLDQTLGVVLEVTADPGGVHEHVDVEAREFLGGADAGELEQLRGVDGAAAHHHLAARDHVFTVDEILGEDLHTGAAQPVEGQPLGPHPGAHFQVGPLAQHGMQVGHRRRRPGAVLERVDLEPVGSVGHRGAGVELRPGDAGLLTGLQQRHTRRVVRRDRADAHRPAPAVVVTGSVVVLQLAEQGEDVGGGPSWQTQ